MCVALLIHPLRESASKEVGALRNEVPLTIERDEMVAVVEHDRLDAAAKCPLQVGRVAKSGTIVAPRMKDKRRLPDFLQLWQDRLD
jgi:hypothetical protein